MSYKYRSKPKRKILITNKYIETIQIKMT